jgi:hypothetical protein
MLFAAQSASASESWVPKKDTISQHLGGVVGIYKFLTKFAVPAIVADPLLKPYFNGEEFKLTESGTQISACLALFLDNALGGKSPKSDALVADVTSIDVIHKCRGDMKKIHKAMKLEDDEFDRFVQIVAEQAGIAGINYADIQAVGAALEKTRRGVLSHH